MLRFTTLVFAALLISFVTTPARPAAAETLTFNATGVGQLGTIQFWTVPDGVTSATFDVQAATAAC